MSTNSNKLNLGSGVLSKLIIQTAGNSVLTEAKNNYPNGINNNSIAITTAGSMTGIKYLYHAALSAFGDEKSSLSVLFFF